MKISKVLETCLYVDDLDKAETFYTQVLGLDCFDHEPGVYAFFTLDGAMLLLFNAEATAGDDQDLPRHGAIGAGHVAFTVDEDTLPAWRDKLAAHDVPIEHEQDWPGGYRSVYFRDPAGNSLELAPRGMWPVLR